MSINNTIVLNSDAGIRIGGPTSFVDPTTGVEVDSATVTGRLYDKKKIRELVAETDGDGGTPTLVSVSSSEPYLVNDPVELRLDNGTYHNTTVASKDDDTDVITLADAVPAGRKALMGTFLKRKLGADISMSLYGGTPAPSVDTWGYIGTVTDIHEGLHLGAKIRCEVDIDDGVNKRRIVVFEAKVVEG